MADLTPEQREARDAVALLVAGRPDKEAIMKRVLECYCEQCRETWPQMTMGELGANLSAFARAIGHRVAELEQAMLRPAGSAGMPAGKRG